MRNALRNFASALLLPLVLASPALAQQTEGTWTLTRKTNDRLQLDLHSSRSNWGNSIDRSDLSGLSDAAIDSRTSAPVTFRIERDAGTFDMEGTFREGRGAGHYTFEPNRAFASTLRSLGIDGADRVTDRELMTLALTGASSARIREYEALGFDGLTLRNVIELSIHGVTPAFIREMREAGLRDLSPQELVKMRIHSVTPAYVREMREAGLAASIDDVVAMRIHGVTVEYVRELAALGYRDLPRQRLLQMAIHGVTPEFIRKVREAGFTDLSAETLVKMRIHDIGPEVLRKRPVRAEA